MNVFELYKKYINKIDIEANREMTWYKVLQEIHRLEIMKRVTKEEADFLIGQINHRYRPNIYPSPESIND